jgi:methionyl-tRNA formyltransferase
MSKDRAIEYRNRAIQHFNAEHEEMTAGEKALVLATLAQVEATLEVVDRLEEGVTVSGDRTLHDGIVVFQTSVKQLVQQLRSLRDR